jgi:hypothetical protein
MLLFGTAALVGSAAGFAAEPTKAPDRRRSRPATTVTTTGTATVTTTNTATANPVPKRRSAPRRTSTTRPANATPTSAAAPGPPATATPLPTVPMPVRLPPFPARLDYQLGGDYQPAADVTVVTRDRTSTPVARSGVYNICYINGFQAQPDELAWWEANHPEVILRDNAGNPVIDPDWNEAILDISTPAKRTTLATVVSGWVSSCRAKGFEAVEFDNLDTYTRFPTYLTQDNAIDMANRLIATSHNNGLAVGQKNSVELIARRPPFDFAVSESCSEFNECQAYFDAYGNNVLLIEYNTTAFRRLCTQFPGKTALLADRNLVPLGTAGHVRQYC